MSHYFLHDSTPGWAVIAICLLIALFGAMSWRSTKGEGWGLVLFLASIILGFNVSVTFASWVLEWMSSMFGGMASWMNSAEQFGGGLGIIATMLVLIGILLVAGKMKGMWEGVSQTVTGTLLGILLRLLSDFAFWLVEQGGF